MNGNHLINIIINSLLGLIVGIILAYLVYNLLNNNVIRGPNSKDIKKKIFVGNENKCYKLVPKIYICPIKYSMSK